MSLPRPFRNLALLVLVCSLLSACVSTEEMQKRQTARIEKEKVAAILPSNSASHFAFRKTKSWKLKIYRDTAALALANPQNLELRISVAEQRGLLLVRELVAMDFPVSTGRKSHPTPTGDFKIIAKELVHHSNLYGKIRDADGNVVVENAESKKNLPPEGSSFEGAPMPYFMRLTNDGVGLHTGVVPGYAASHGCIRLPKTVAPLLYKTAGVGTPVSVSEG